MNQSKSYRRVTHWNRTFVLPRKECEIRSESSLNQTATLEGLQCKLCTVSCCNLIWASSKCCTLMFACSYRMLHCPIAFKFFIEIDWSFGFSLNLQLKYEIFHTIKKISSWHSKWFHFNVRFYGSKLQRLNMLFENRLKLTSRYFC